MTKRFLLPIGTKLKEYVSDTTIHGLRYFVESRSNLEKGIWGIVIFTSMVSALYNVAANYAYSLDHPIITTLDTTVVQNVRLFTILTMLFSIFLLLEIQD